MVEPWREERKEEEETLNCTARKARKQSISDNGKDGTILYVGVWVGYFFFRLPCGGHKVLPLRGGDLKNNIAK